jgi:hypothetical protein
MHIHPLSALAASNPGNVNNLKYATESWTLGGMILGVIIVAVLFLLFRRLPS